MGCGCGGSGRGRSRYKVIYPDGRLAIKNTLADAELAKAKIPGARIEKAR
jgi:hypothetical protein